MEFKDRMYKTGKTIARHAVLAIVGGISGYYITDKIINKTIHQKSNLDSLERMIFACHDLDEEVVKDIKGTVIGAVFLPFGIEIGRKYYQKKHTSTDI